MRNKLSVLLISLCLIMLSFPIQSLAAEESGVIHIRTVVG